MSPPQLTADAPVLDVLHPVAIGVFVFRRIELDVVVHHRFERDLRQVLHFEKPLHRQLRLNDHVGTFRIAHLVGVGLDLLEQAGLLQVLFDLTAHVEAVHAHIHAGSLADGAVVVEDVNGFQVEFFAQHVVVDVVGRRYLEATRTKLDIDIVVFDDRDFAAYQGHHHFFAFEVLVLGVVGVDTHGGIAHNRFGTGGRHNGIPLLAYDFIAQVVEFAVLFLVNHLFVGEGGQGLGVPVDHAHAAVDQAFVVQIAEDLDDAFGTGLVHRETGAVPIARCAQLAKLLEDDAAMFVGPGPRVLEELFAGQVGLFDALTGQTVHHFGFGGDGGMVGTRHPAGVKAHHARTTHQDVLNGVVEHVAHVQHARHIGGRNDDGIGFAAVGGRFEQGMVDPILVPFRFDFGRTVLCG